MYGAVIFDEKERPGPGWASRQGQPAVRIRGTGDLASDVYWWTNLSFSTFRVFGLSRHNLKRHDYLRPDMDQLHKELGLFTSRLAASRIAEISAEIFDRVMRMASAHYGLEKPADDTLIEDLYAKLVRQDRMITPEINKALGQAWQTWSICEAASPTGSKIMAFKRPRILHAQEVLATPIPGELWEHIPEKDMPAESKRVDWLINQNRPALVRATVDNVDPEVSKIIAFSGGSNRERSWMSHPELLSLSRFAKIKIESAFLANEYAPCQVNRPLYTGGPMGMLSVSAGILSENYWIAIASTLTINKRSKDNREVIYSPRAVWMSAADRFFMMLPALMLHGSGFVVKAYGRGGVNVAVQRGMLADVRACAISAGLNAPLNVQEEIAIQEALST